MVNHCCIQYCKQDNAGLGKKFRLSSDPSIRQSWIEVIEKVNGGKLKVSQAMNLLLKYQDTLDDGVVGHNCNLCKLEFTEKMADIYDSWLRV